MMLLLTIALEYDVHLLKRHPTQLGTPGQLSRGHQTTQNTSVPNRFIIALE